MTTVSDLGINGIKKEMAFKDPNSNTVDRYVIISDVQSGIFGGQYFEVNIHYTDNTIIQTKWFDYELKPTGWIGQFIKIEESSDNDKYYWEKYQSEKPKPLCFHGNKKKVIVFNLSGYWYCPDCKMDIATLTEEEFYQAVKEQTGGKPVKKAPPMGQTRRR